MRLHGPKPQGRRFGEFNSGGAVALDPSSQRGTDGSDPFPPAAVRCEPDFLDHVGYARSDSGPCRLGPTYAVIALVSAPGSTLADSHVAGPRGRSEEWYYKRGFWPRPFHYTEENRQRMLDPTEADD